MNYSLQRSRTERSSDFSIARILSKDNDKGDATLSRCCSNERRVNDQFYQGRNVTGTAVGREDIATLSKNHEETSILNSKECQGGGTIDHHNSLVRIGCNEVDGTKNEIQDSAQSRSIDAYDEEEEEKEKNIGKRMIDASYGVETQRNNELAWLQYTRYRPPKLPRKSLIGKSAKRRPGVHPRIPFSSFQLQVLEERYKRNAYLSRRDALDISTSLRLPQSRVKIWFQNRRARDRRESNNVMAVT